MFAMFRRVRKHPKQLPYFFKGMETMALQMKDNDQGWQSGNSIAVENLATKGLLIAGWYR